MKWQTLCLLFLQYNGYKRSAYNFYMFGHCASFAHILWSVFDGKGTIYYSDSHVITKIGNDFFSVLGEVNEEYRHPSDGSFYEELPFEYLKFVEQILSTGADHDYDIQKQLIDIGKKKVHEPTENLQNVYEGRSIA